MELKLAPHYARIQFEELEEGIGNTRTLEGCIEAFDYDEAKVLLLSAVHSSFPLARDTRVTITGVGDDVEADDYSRFELEENVLAAIPVNNMISPIPTYAVGWDILPIYDIVSGGPYLRLPNGVIHIGMTPYGVRKLELRLA